ncbi:MAG: HAD family phosphatase [Phycisphaeraceae bacterium]|nr:HAD family phosphatase [Phycisphaeraceae bacterium]
MPRHRYDIVAIDLDGTLVDHTGRIHPDNVRAIERARDAGITVTLCTGRALIECRREIDAVGQRDPVIVSGGALVSDPVSGRTLERFEMPRALVRRVVDDLRAHDHPALLLKDPDAAGFDYLVVGPEGESGIDPASRWWFRQMGVRARYVSALDHDEHPEHTIRVGAYSANEPVDELARRLHERYHAEVMLQHFCGVLLPRERREQGVDSVHIVELFNPRADKWQALQRLAARTGVPEARTAAIGDQTNDLSMITHAGLGVAMGNAHEKVAAAADRRTAPAEEAGVALALDRIVAGDW